MKVGMVQDDFVVGDVAGNVEKIIGWINAAKGMGVELLVFPEMTVSGYPPEDLLLRRDFVLECERGVGKLVDRIGDMTVVVGSPQWIENGSRSVDAALRTVSNCAYVLDNNDECCPYAQVYEKQRLPNYGVFDEARYFEPGWGPTMHTMKDGTRVRVLICEDLWDQKTTDDGSDASDVTVVLNASPFHVGKHRYRHTLVRDAAIRTGNTVVYVNCVGGQDELVFDGGSMAYNPAGELIANANRFLSELFVFDTNGPALCDAIDLKPEPEIWKALKTGLRGYVTKNGFTDVVVGLSGGIDSALTAAVAVEALGTARVHGVTMPSNFSSVGSWRDSEELADNLGIDFQELPIRNLQFEVLDTLNKAFAGKPVDTTEENLQARLRGLILMALSNKHGWLVLTTGNKSEMAVGYATLYGDMAGGFGLLKDVPKTMVYRLARWYNDQRGTDVIPESTLTKPPSAELAHDQTDEASLLPYDVLDPILEAYIEQGLTVDEIVAAQGIDHGVVRRFVRMVDANEYKRRQAPPGTKITPLAFGRDRRLPISNKWSS